MTQRDFRAEIHRVVTLRLLKGDAIQTVWQALDEIDAVRAERDRLRTLNAELVEELETFACECTDTCGRNESGFVIQEWLCARKRARGLITKAKGETA